MMRGRGLPGDVSGTILKIIRLRGKVSGASLAAELGVSRQAVHRHLGRLLDAGRVEREGRTRGALYRLPGSTGSSARRVFRYGRVFEIEGLQEDVVFRDLAALLNLKSNLSGPAYGIFSYAFTEMLNNAIEHSQSPSCRVDAEVAPREVTAVIRDFGVGAFNSIALRLGLRDENDALGELLKGKATTMPERHSGEGIFFTSKVCDLFALRSHRIELTTGSAPRGVVVTVRKPIRGTEVRFHVSRSARRKMAEVFARFAPEDYDFRFSKSVVTVRFSAREYVSRSEARRLLARLDQFREVVFDFAGVRILGQAFADEIFRVFASSHPDIRFTYVNVDPALEAVIRHVVDNTN